jgi:hypothetical protein
MADYQDWVDNHEDEESQLPPESFTPEIHLRAKRKSIVIHDLSKKAAKAKEEEAPPPSSAPAGEDPSSSSSNYLPPLSSTSRINTPSAGNRSSRIFLEMEIAEPVKKEASGEKVYKTEAKWPWVLLALFFLAGSLAMAVFGGICIRTDFEDPSNSASACGPGRGWADFSFFLSFFLSF